MPKPEAPPTPIPLRIGNHIVLCRLPYHAGDIMTAEEAHALNRIRTEGLHRSLTALHKRLYDTHTPGDAYDAFELAALERERAYSVKSAAPIRRADPITAEAMRLARIAIVAANAKRGVSEENIPDLEDLVMATVTTDPRIREAATQRVSQLQALGAKAIAKLAPHEVEGLLP